MGAEVKRLRHAILVQLCDGPTGAGQEAAIRSLAKSGSSLSSVLRSILLREAGAFDLDVPVVDRMPRPCRVFTTSTSSAERCVCGAERIRHR